MRIRSRFDSHQLNVDVVGLWLIMLGCCAVLVIVPLYFRGLPPPDPPTGPQTAEEVAVAYVPLPLGEGDRRGMGSLQTYAESGGTVEECAARPVIALPDYAGGPRAVSQMDLDQIGVACSSSTGPSLRSSRASTRCG